jgi:phosphonate transport system permease protein
MHSRLIKRYVDFGLCAIIAVVIVLSFRIVKVDFRSLVEGLPLSIDMIREMMPPDFSIWRSILRLSLETLVIGLWGTILGIVLSFPIGFLAARNTTPNAVIHGLAKSLICIMRSIPELVYALIFISSMGLGKLPGIMTIMFHTVGLAAKFYAEAIESIDTKPVEATKSTGSHALNVIRHAILPQLVPLFTGYTLFVLDHNIRTVVGIGVIGAGGIGTELYRNMRQFRYTNVSAIVIVIFLAVLAIDRISAYLRQTTTDGEVFSPANRKYSLPLLALIAVLFGYAVIDMSTQLGTLAKSIPLLAEILGYMFPPDFTHIGRYTKLIVETMGMAIAGSTIAVFLGIIFGILSARNIVRCKPLNVFASLVCSYCRAMPDVLFALFFVVSVGLGPFSGVIALALSSIGFLGKFYGEAIENIDPKPLEAIDATGATTSQKIMHAVVPQVLPYFHSYNLYIIDRNVRSSTILGIVGAGGIGFELMVAMRLQDYQQTAAIVIVIFITVLAVDYLSTEARKRVLA